jgi:hypothetical protein
MSTGRWSQRLTPKRSHFQCHLACRQPTDVLLGLAVTVPVAVSKLEPLPEADCE